MTKTRRDYMELGIQSVVNRKAYEDIGGAWSMINDFPLVLTGQPADESRLSTQDIVTAFREGQQIARKLTDARS